MRKPLTARLVRAAASAALGWLVLAGPLNAQTLRIDTAQCRADGAAPEATDLPASPEPPPGTQRLRCTLDLPKPTGGEPLALWWPGLRAHAALSMNGQLLREASQSPVLPRGQDELVLLPLPAALWREGGNQVEMDLRAEPRLGLPAPELGPLAVLEARQREAVWAQVDGPLLVAAVLAASGSAVLWLWWRQREPAFALFGFGALAWALHNVVTVMPWPAWPHAVYAVAWNTLYALVVALLVGFCLELAGWRGPLANRLLVLLVLSAPPLLLLALLLDRSVAGTQAWRLLLLASAGWAAAALVRLAWRWRDRRSLALALVGSASIGLGVHDWLADHDAAQTNPLMWMPYGGLLFAATVVGLLIDRFVSLSQERTALNRDLARRVAEQGEQLRESVEQMRAARDAAQAADRAKSRFLAAASHDLRQPAHALGLYLAALPEQGLQAPQRDILARMREALAALQRMFDALLDISRIDAGAVVPAPQPLRVAPLLQRLADEYGPQAEARGLRLMLRSGPPDMRVRADPLLLERILRNLLSNALKYTQAGGVLLAARPRGGACRIEVWDSGCGIDPAEQQRVFEAFYQSPSRPTAIGLGLGLAIVQRLAALQGLPLQLRSRPGHGTQVGLSLPLTEAPEPEPTAAPPTTDLRGCCIGLIEDDERVRQATTLLLQQWGCRVSSGADADALLAQGGERLALLIVDLQLQGGRSGPQEAERLMQAWGRRLPVLVVSGETGAEAARLPERPGWAWRAKPLAPERLQQALVQLLGAAAC